MVATSLLQAYKTRSISVPHDTGVNVPFDYVQEEGGFNGSSSSDWMIYTIENDGWFHITCQISLQGTEVVRLAGSLCVPYYAEVATSTTAGIPGKKNPCLSLSTVISNSSSHPSALSLNVRIDGPEDRMLDIPTRVKIVQVA